MENENHAHAVRLAGVMAAVPLPMVAIGPDARILALNAGAEALFGTSVVGRASLIAMRQPGLQDAISAALGQDTPGHARYVIPGPSSEAIYRVAVTPVTGLGAICTFEDISDAEQIGQMRRDFVANVSHELRTPLTALLGFIETLQGAARDDAAARDRFLGIMASEAGRMNRLVRDLLHLSRVEAEERVRPTVTIDLAAIIVSAITSLRPMADAAGVKLDLIADGGPWTLPADQDQMMQVFHNLIENAVKYGGSGGIVTVTLAQDTLPGSPALRIDVTDKGEGLDPIHLPRLTERFYRVDEHRSRAEGGTGLGLAIVKHIVNRHRGRLRIDSAPGQGSTFSLILPTR